MANKIDRRNLLKIGGVTVGSAALVKALAPIAGYAGEISQADFFQKHYQELSPAEMDKVLARLEAQTKSKRGVDVSIEAPKPNPGESFGYALNLSICIGCRKCTEGCQKENNLDRETNASYTRVFELEPGGIDFSKANATYDHPVPAEDHSYMPVQCQHCNNAPCIRVCPVKATWQEDDGIVVVDYNWCIGCRYCAAACPYHARKFNWDDAKVPAEEINPNQSYLSNRERPKGVMEKCTFCLHLTRKGKLPACAEVCPTGARIFGNLLDENSPIRSAIKNKRVFIFKEELGTRPRFFYFFDE
jgi:Fe-S-cluster-containing dehydrogenase component